MADQHLPSHWKEKLCAVLSIGDWRNGVFPHQVMRYFEAQARAEGGTAKWNPLNTSEAVHSDDFGNWYETPDYNSIPVRNYKTQALGIMATALTYLAPKYAGLLDALRTADATGLTAEQIVNAHKPEIRTWGTSPDLMLQVLKEIT
jgi:hypothetical protein